MSSLHLKDNPTLADLQKYVEDMIAERGFTDNVSQRFMLLIEEVGEFAKAARRHGGLRYAEDARDQNLEGEAADVFLVLLGLCNQLGIDLEQAFRVKEDHNKKRTWK